MPDGINPSRRGQTTFTQDMGSLWELVKRYGQGVASGEWATPYADTPATDIGQRAEQLGQVAQDVRPTFGMDWDKEGFAADVKAGNYGQAVLKLGGGVANAGLDVLDTIDPGSGTAIGTVAAAPFALARRSTRKAMSPDELEAAIARAEKREVPAAAASPPVEPSGHWPDTPGAPKQPPGENAPAQGPVYDPPPPPELQRQVFREWPIPTKEQFQSGYSPNAPGYPKQPRGKNQPPVHGPVYMPRTAPEFPGVAPRGATEPTPALMKALEERYPPPESPYLQLKTPKKDKATGEWIDQEGYFLAKAQSPEAKEMMKWRDKIRKDMEKNGYEPYFDVSKRYDVDPGHYPAPGDTRTEALPATQKTRDKYLEQAMHPDALAKLATAYEKGLIMPNTKDWYFMGQLEQASIDELGPVAGRAAFKDMMGQMAATTGGASPSDNFLAAQYARWHRDKGLYVPERGFQVQSPVGGRFISENMKQSNQFGGQFEAALNPKRHDFHLSLMGHKNRPVMDEQMMTTGWNMNVPPGGAYGSFTEPIHKLAADYGTDPREFQGVGWSGGKSLKDPKYTSGQPFIQTVNEAIERSRRLHGTSAEEALRQAIIRARKPTY